MPILTDHLLARPLPAGAVGDVTRYPDVFQEGPGRRIVAPSVIVAVA